MSEMVELLISDIRRALEAEMYAVALVGALILPDICAAMEAADGMASKENYIGWLKRWIISITSEVTHEDVYAARCQVLHQGATSHRGQKGRRFRWHVGDHDCGFFLPRDPIDWSGNPLGLHLPGICKMLCNAAEQWLKSRDTDSLSQPTHHDSPG